MVVSAMIYIKRFIKTGSGIQKLIGEEYIDTQAYLYFIKVRKLGQLSNDHFLPHSSQCIIY
jgi:hypothetical protein